MPKDNKKIFTSIIRAIVLAQIASDAGKEIPNTVGDFKGVNNALRLGYKAKTFYEAKAINLINNNPQMGINFWCEYTPEETTNCGFMIINEPAYIMVYFEVHHDGKRYQIYFHNPVGSEEHELTGFCSTGRKTRWNKDFGGSREAATELAKIFLVN